MINVIDEALLNANASRKCKDCIVSTGGLSGNAFPLTLNELSMIFISNFARFLSLTRHLNALDEFYKSSTSQTISLSCWCGGNMLIIFRILMGSGQRRPDSDPLGLGLGGCVASAVVGVCAARVGVRLAFP